jgi:hypothetical protein
VPNFGAVDCRRVVGNSYLTGLWKGFADIAMHRLYWSPDSKYIYFTASIESAMSATQIFTH